MEELEKYNNNYKNEECIMINIYSKCKRGCECKNQPSICLNIINEYDNNDEKICFGKKDDCCVLINIITKCKNNETPVEINVITD